jgi:uncharacterized protein YjbI with pentapeptide repeats
MAGFQKLVRMTGSFVPGYLKRIETLDFSYSNFSSPDEFKGLSFCGANFSHSSFSANLDGADLTACNLSHSYISSATFVSANLVEQIYLKM